jgi:hypothetical protein
MRSIFGRYARFATGLLVFILSFSPVLGLAAGPSGMLLAKVTNETPGMAGEMAADRGGQGLEIAMAVQDRNTEQLMSRPDVLGTATSLTEDGRPAIVVFTRKKAQAGIIPDHLEGVPVVERVTGEIVAMTCPPGASDPTDPKAAFTKPVPIGVSTGNATATDWATGTISARVKDTTGKIYAMSNNHVYALENTAQIGSQVLQPGLVDSGGVPGTSIGTLYTYVPISFKRKNKNYVDAALAISSTANLCNSTPTNGYGTPGSTILALTSSDVNTRAVQKYGRTTSLTKGTVSGINATVTVNYGNGRNATFYKQITVSSSSAFILAGDSGSLLVTGDGNANPVGLLFAGNQSGTLAIANQIGEVLSELGARLGSTISIDGK